MNPILSGLINIIPGIINTVGSLIREKKNNDPKTNALLPAFVEDKNNIADGLEVSSKTVIGYGVGGAIVYYALQHEPLNLYVLAIGAAVVIATTIAKALEKK